MNKETFLEELRGYLRILEDQEQEDILEEYAQHIDMKIQKGLTEEEAIRDFGPMKELAAEILEAYHVKPEFDSKKPAARMPVLKGAGISKIGTFFRKTGSFLKTKTKACIQGTGRGFHWFGRKCRELAAWVRKPFSGREEMKPAVDYERQEIEAMQGEAGRQQDMEERRAAGTEPAVFSGQKKPGAIKQICTVFGRGIKRLWNWIVRLSIWWMRLLWNLTWLFMSVFCGFLAMITLAGLGAGLILLPQGYPLLGILIICLGGMLCFGALSCGAYSLMLRRKKEVIERFTDISSMAGNCSVKGCGERDAAELE